MTEETARKLLDMTAESYRKISQPFSDTRNRVWTDCKAFDRIVKAGSRVLDAGCGNGKLVPWLADKHLATYVGVDLNPHFIGIAKERYAQEKYHFFEGDLLALDRHPSLSSSVFDVALCIAVLHHFSSERMRLTVLKNLRSRLPAGGVLAMTNWNFFQIVGASKSVWKQAMRRTTEQALYAQFPDMSWRDLLTHWKGADRDEILYYHAFTPTEINRLCVRAGFTHVRSWYGSYGEQAHWWNGRNISTIAYA